MIDELKKFNKVPEIRVTYRNKTKKDERLKITSSKEVYEILKVLFKKEMDYKEMFCLICLNRANELLGYSIISSGGINGTIVDIKVIFQIALKANASGLIISHNHPSGNLHPSKSDNKITNKIFRAGKIMDIPILDHVIITSEGYYSFADNDLLT